MKKLILSLIVSFGLSVSLSASDLCKTNYDLINKHLVNMEKASKLKIKNEILSNIEMIKIYSGKALMECNVNSKEYKEADLYYNLYKGL